MNSSLEDVVLRPAVPADLPEILGMCQAAVEESTSTLPYDNQAMLESLAVQSLFALVADLKGELQGMFLGKLVQYTYARQVFARDILVYVKPEYRGGFVLVNRMLRAFENWAKSLGAREAMLTYAVEMYPKQTRLKSMGRWSSRMGYKFAGVSYMRKL